MAASLWFITGGGGGGVGGGGEGGGHGAPQKDFLQGESLKNTPTPSGLPSESPLRETPWTNPLHTRHVKEDVAQY